MTAGKEPLDPAPPDGGEPGRAEQDRQYAPSSVVGDIEPFLDAYVERSTFARRLVGDRAHLDLSYGPRPRQALDVLPPPEAAGASADAARTAGAPWPVLVWLHGGFWQQRDKGDAAFPALGVGPAGWGVVAAGYSLTPEVRLDEVVEECRSLVHWLHRELPGLGGDPSRIVVGGHSAGAHLAAMLLVTDWPARGLDLVSGSGRGPVLAGGLLVGGVYDLEPVRHSYVNDAVRMDAAEARRCSPVRRTAPSVPVLVAWGEHETLAFRRQSLDLVRRWGAEPLELRGRHHFDAPLELADPGSELSRRTLRLLDGLRPAP